MLLNDTNPPLEEALSHYGVPGMKWGVRRIASSNQRRQARARAEAYDDFDEQDRRDRTKRNLAVGILVGAGAVATVAVLQKNGKLGMAKGLAKGAAANFARDSVGEAWVKQRRSDRKERRAGKPRMKDRTFRPENVSNPLWTVHPKGRETVNNFGKDVWDVPMLAITSGRK